MTACNARPPENDPYWRATSGVACHLPAGHLEKGVPHSWDVEAAMARHRRISEEFSAEKAIYHQALTVIAASRWPTSARRRARLALAGQGQPGTWRLPAFMDTFDVRALVVEREHGHLSDVQFVEELGRHLAGMA